MNEDDAPIFMVRFYVNGSDPVLSERDMWFRDREDYEWFLHNRPSQIVITDIHERCVWAGKEAVESAQDSVACPIEEDDDAALNPAPERTDDER